MDSDTLNKLENRLWDAAIIKQRRYGKIYLPDGAVFKNYEFKIKDIFARTDS